MLTRERSTTGELWEYSSHSPESAGRTQAVPLAIFSRATAVDGVVSSSSPAPADRAGAARRQKRIARKIAVSAVPRGVSMAASYRKRSRCGSLAMVHIVGFLYPHPLIWKYSRFLQVWPQGSGCGGIRTPAGFPIAPQNGVVCKGFAFHNARERPRGETAARRRSLMTLQGYFHGVYPILATPFDDREHLDLESFGRIVRFMADIGVDGVTILGVLGESGRLVDSERERLIQCAVAAAGGRIPVIVGTSHKGTMATRTLSRMAESLGAAAVMVTPSREPVPGDDRVFEYFRRAVEGISIPVVVQDHPASTEVHMPVELLLRIVKEIPGVACIKEEAPPTPTRIAALNRGMTDFRVPILTGLGALYGLFDLECGSSGFMTGFAFPEVLIALVKAVRENRMGDAWDLYRRFLPLIVFQQQPGVAVRKEILRMRGLIASGRVRHPGPGLDPAAAVQLRALLDRTLPGVDLTRPLAL